MSQFRPSFKLPNLVDRFIQGANGNLGTSVDAGLPNIKGSTSGFYGVNLGKEEGAIYNPGGNSKQGLSGSWGSTLGIGFDASKSNAIYGNSDTVQPPAVCLNYIIRY